MGKRLLYKFKRGLGKEQIGIARLACHKCGRGGITLFAVGSGGKRVYACSRHKELYQKHDKGDGRKQEKEQKRVDSWVLSEMRKKGGRYDNT